MKKSETKNELLKRTYHILLLMVFLCIAYVMVICWFVFPFLSSDNTKFFVCVVPLLIVVGVWAKRQRKRLEDAQISGGEWQEFLLRQPLMKLVFIGMAILLVFKIFKLIG